MYQNTLVNIFFVAIFLCILFLVGLLIWPFLPAIIFGTIFAGIFYPSLDYIIQKFKISRRAAATLVCVLIILIIFLPTLYLVSELTQQAFTFYEYLKSSVSEKLIREVFFGEGWLATQIKKISELMKFELNFSAVKTTILEHLKNVTFTVFNTLSFWLNNLVSFLFQFFIMLLVIFSLFAEGPSIKDFILKLSPLPEEEEELIISKFNQMNYMTIVCNGLGGLIQGVLAGIGFWMAGIQSALLWSTIMVILAFIPLVGISIIFIPAGLYLLFTDKVISAVVLLVYCTLVALLVENWFKPKFVGNRLQINSILIFFSIMGGMSVFGMAGIFYGPLITIIFLTLVGLYHDKYAPKI